MDNTVGSRDNALFSLSETERAFIAGFLEGDGCIAAKISPTSGSYRVLITISFTQREEARSVLEYLAQLVQERVSDYPTHNMAEVVIRDRRKVANVLICLRPFLVSKQKQAQLGLRVIEVLNRSRRGKLRSSENLLEAVQLAEEIRALNSSRKSKVVHTLETVRTRLRERGFVT